MQFVNHDMDDMLRRAAENYPLDTNSADWNKVYASLMDNEEKMQSTPARSRKGRLLWLLMLLPVALVCNYYMNPVERDKGIVHNNKTTATRKGNDQATLSTKNDNNRNDKTSTGNYSQKNKIPVQDNMMSGQGSTEKNISAHIPQVAGYNKKTLNAVNNKPVAGENKYPTSRGKYVLANTDKAGLSYNKDLSVKAVDDNKNVQDLAAATLNRERVKASLYKVPIERTGIDTKVDGKNSLLDRFEANQASMARQPNRQRSSMFYLGFMGGVDATTIKFQKIENAGFDYGVLLGYRFNNKWSVEAGAFMDRKSYYSDGEYFNTARLYLSPNTKVTSVSGNCNMWEIPLSIKYNFRSAARHSWFGTAGVSSYLMKEEDYSYEYYYTGSGTSATHYKSYRNSSKNLFSVLQVTGGYTHKIGNRVDLRIEPYLKMPISKMGIGKVPLLSTGIHIGITREMF